MPASRRFRRQPLQSSRRDFFRPRGEQLEGRAMLAADFQLVGTQEAIVLSDSNVSREPASDQSEMMVDINPTNPLNVVGFSHNLGNTNEIDLFVSGDGGSSWTTVTIDDGTRGLDDGLPAGKRFDPAIAFAPSGALFIAYGHTAGGNTQLVVARSDNGGASIATFNVIDARQDIGSTPGVDKWQLATGPDGLGGEAVYVAYTRNEVELGFITDQQICVRGSNDGGANWVRQLALNDESDGSQGQSNLFADPAVGPNGELYISWGDFDSGKIRFDHDIDGLFRSDHTFTVDRIVDDDLNMPAWTLSVPAQNRRGILSGPVLDIDRSGGIHHGRLYLTYIKRQSGANPADTDVKLAFSDDHGHHWTILTADGSVGTQFLPWVDVDQQTGAVGILYYSSATDASTGNDDVFVQLALTTDGGSSFRQVEVSSASSNSSLAANSNEFLEYIGFAIHGGTAHAFWADNRSPLTSEFEAWTAPIALASLSNGGNRLVIRTTPADDEITIRRNSNPLFLEVITNGVREFIGLADSVGSIFVFGGLDGSNDHVTVNFSQGYPLPVNRPDAPIFSYFGGDGNDVLTFRGFRLRGGDDFFFSGGDGYDRFVWDNVPSTSTATLGSSSLMGTDGTRVDYFNVEDFKCFSYTGTLDFVVDMQPNLALGASLQNVTLDLSNDRDRITVSALREGVTLLLDDSHDPSPINVDTIRVGGGDYRRNIAGTMIHTIDAGRAQLTIDDSQAPGDSILFPVSFLPFVVPLPVPDTYAIGEGTFQKILAAGPGPVLQFGDVAELTLLGSDAANIFNVNATRAGQELVLAGNAGTDDFRINATALRSDVRVLGGDPAGTALGDTLIVTGTSADSGSYLPGTQSNDGRVTANGHNIDFSGLEPVYAEGFGTFSFITPRSRDVIDIREYPSRAFAGTPTWMEFSGTSGVFNTPFETLRVFDIGTLTAVFNAFDLIPQPPSGAFDPTDLVTIHPNALSGNRVDRLQVLMGIGNDRLIDHTLEGSPATTALSTIFSTPVIHEVTGVAARVELGSLRAFDADGELIHDVESRGSGVLILTERYPQITATFANAQTTLSAGDNGLQRLQSSASLMTFEFQTTLEGRFSLQPTGHSSVRIDSIRTPRPLELVGDSGISRTTIENGRLSGPQSQGLVDVRGFDEKDTLVFLNRSDSNTPGIFEFDLTGPDAHINVCKIPTLPMFVCPALDVHMSGARPTVEFVGGGSGADSIRVVVVDSYSIAAGPQPEPPVRTDFIERLELVGPKLFLVPRADGGLHVESRSVANVVRVDSDSHVREVSLDTLTNASLPSDLGTVEITYPEPDFRPLAINTSNAAELRVYSESTDFIGTRRPVTQEMTPHSGRINVGNWTLTHDGALRNSVVEASTVDVLITGESFRRDLSLDYRYLGSEGKYVIKDVTFEGKFDLTVEHKDGATNTTTIQQKDTVYKSTTTTKIVGAEGGTDEVLVTKAGVETKEGSKFEADLKTGDDLVIVTTTDSGPAEGKKDEILIKGTGEDGSTAEVKAILVHKQQDQTPDQQLVNLQGEKPEYAIKIDALKGKADQSVLAEKGTPKTEAGDTSVAYTGEKTKLDLFVKSVSPKTLETTVKNSDGSSTIEKVGNVAVTVPELVGMGIDPDGQFSSCAVTNTYDSGPGSLREAIECANLAPSAATAVVSFAIDEVSPVFTQDLGTESSTKVVAADAAGNSLVLGFSAGLSDLDRDAEREVLVPAGNFLAKYAPDGRVLWAVHQWTGDLFFNDMAVDSAGNILIGGFYLGDVDLDPGAGVQAAATEHRSGFLLKLDAQGALAWARTQQSYDNTGLGGSPYPLADIRDLAFDAQGNAYVTGTFVQAVHFASATGPGTSLISDGTWDGFNAKYDAQGELVWLNQLRNARANQLAVTPDGAVYTAGLIAVEMGHPDDDRVADFDSAVYPDNRDILIPNRFQEIAGFLATDVFVLRNTPDGRFDWVRKLGADFSEHVTDLAVDEQGDITIAGAFNGSNLVSCWGQVGCMWGPFVTPIDGFAGDTVDFDPGPGEYLLTTTTRDAEGFVWKLDQRGEFVWARSIGSDVAFTGYFDPNVSRRTIPSLEIDADGDILVARTVSQGPSIHAALTIELDPVFGGVTYTRQGTSDLYFIALDRAGNLQWTNSIAGAGASVSLSGMAQDGAGDVFLTGFIDGTADLDPGMGARPQGDGSYLLKLTIPEQVDVDAHLPGGDPQGDVFVIAPLSPLPALVRGNIVINGQSQQNVSGDSNPFGPEIVLSGQFAGESASGLEIHLQGNRIHGLNIQGFAGNGILIGGDANVVTGSFLGTNATGTGAAANLQNGVLIQSAGNNVIGGASAADRNVISGNAQHGVQIVGNGAAPPPSDFSCRDLVTGAVIDCPSFISGNTVAGNFIGTDASGMRPLGNVQNGVFIEDSGFNTVGGSGPAARNVISGQVVGVAIVGTRAELNHVAANYIGLAVDGRTALGNTHGVIVHGDALGFAPSGNRIGGTTAAERNVISGNYLNNIFLARTLGTIVQGNFIGPDETGSAVPLGDDPRGRAGIKLEDDRDSLIGGTSVGAGNVISNNAFGVFLDGRWAPGGTQRTQIQGNRIGTTADGRHPLGVYWGIYVNGQVDSNSVTHEIRDVVIGGSHPNAGNLISGNTTAGVHAFGSGAIDLSILGNLIGTDVDGLAAVPNGWGVVVENTHGVSVGGVGEGARNVISGNIGSGVTVLGGSENTIQGNLIGLDSAGEGALGNRGDGVSVVESSFNSLQDNTISSNESSGIYLVGVTSTSNLLDGNRIGTSRNGLLDRGNLVMGVFLLQGSNNTLRNNLISGNDNYGVAIAAGSNAHVIENNFIGTNESGESAVGNTYGLFIAANSNVVRGNVVSGNLNDGIIIDGQDAGDGRGSANVLQGNLIGLNAEGASPLGRQTDGVRLRGGARGNRVVDNVISGNERGLQLADAATTNNYAQGNLFGTDAEGMARIPNYDSVVIVRASGNWIGGAGPGEGNLISGSERFAIDSSSLSGNTIQGNLIGTDANGNGTPDVWNAHGIHLYSDVGTLVENNVIVGSGFGIWLGGLDGPTRDVQIRDNRIGTTRGDQAWGNDWGVYAEGNDGHQVRYVQISGNVIAWNDLQGVVVTGAGAQEISIRGNSIHDNGALGIDLGNDGVTPNDNGNATASPPVPPDGDVGPNNLQNAPVVQSTIFGNTTRVAGQLRSTPNSLFTIDFYASTAADLSGFGEGQRWLDAIQVTTDTLGVAGFSTELPAAAVGEFVTATATNAAGSTSEFSNALVVRGRPNQRRALAAAALPASATAESLSADQLGPIIQEALARWRATGIRLPSPHRIEVGTTDLPDDLLGLADGNTIWIDSSAAGWGWFVDPTPGGDLEFFTPGDQGEQGRMDLLSAVMHELGHLLGLDHKDDGVMHETLSAGTRTSLDQISESDWLLCTEAIIAEISNLSGTAKRRRS